MIYLTLPPSTARASLQLRHLHRFPPRPTDTAVDCVFYDQCPVLTAETSALRDSRLLLVDLTDRVIRQALDLLGIRTVERM